MEQDNDLLEGNFRNASPYRTLFFLFKKEKVCLLWSMFFFTLKNVPDWLFPIVIAKIINTVNPNSGQPLSTLWWWLGIYGVLVMQNIPTYVLHRKFFSKASRNVEYRLRGALVQRLQHLSLSFHDDFESGRLHSKVLRDVEALEQLCNQLISSIYPAVITIAIAVVVTLNKQPVIALFYLLAVPITTILMRLFRKRLRESNRNFRTAVESMSSRISEMLDMIPVTRAHAVEEEEIRKTNNKFDYVRKNGMKLDVLNAFFVSSSWVSFQAFMIACLAVAGYMAWKGTMPIGDVVMYQGFFAMIVRSVGIILNIFPMLAKGFEAIRSMGEILECPDLEKNAGCKKMHAVKGDIHFDQVNFFYSKDTEPAVKNFNLHVHPGEVIAFVGESGSGKSTIMNLAIGFRRPTTGDIYLDGENMNQLDLRSFRKHISVVPQQTILFAGTVKENITYGLHDISDEELQNAVEQANAAEFIRRLPEGLDTRVGENGAKLSGGQRQRIAIARALLRDPRILILDEATSALDVMSEKNVQEALERLIKGRTTFIVAHRLSTIRNADRVIVMKEGICVETGSQEELLKKRGEFYTLRSLQV